MADSDTASLVPPPPDSSPEAGASARRFPSTRINHCAVPPWAIASTEFNANPIRLELDGVRPSNRRIFETLDRLEDPAERGRIFVEYLSVKFRLHEWNQHQAEARRSLRNSWLRFLRGWGIDSNGIEGAVLKGWVESRFGIPPTYHKGKIDGSFSETLDRYAIDRMKGHACTNAIDAQLDLLFEFCQYELGRRFPGRTHWTLYRGTCDSSEYKIIEKGPARSATVQLNNLSSFTGDRERAWEFGSTVWKTEVPLSKIFFFGDVLPGSILKGESEFLVIGGAYRLAELLF